MRFSRFLFFITLSAATLAVSPTTHASATKDGASSVVNAYLTVHTALAGDDLPAALKGFIAVQKATAHAKGGHGVSVDLAVSIDKAASTGTGSKSLDEARKAFKELSVKVIELAEKAPDAELRVAFCPMVMGGSRWIQKGDTVQNPYYGKAMLGCGTVEGPVGKAGGHKEKHDH